MNMKKSNYFLLLLFSNLLTYSLYSQKKSVNLNLLTQNLHYLHKNLSLSVDFKSVNLRGPKSNGSYGFDETAVEIELPTQEFLKQYIWSQSVFAAKTGSGKGRGTAFLVGENLVLTNKHVAETTNRKKECGKFEIDTKIIIEETITCKKIHYCSDKHDFCLIELNKTKDGKNLSELFPSFSLKHKIDKKIDSVYVIGNSGNFGIQGSKGRDNYISKATLRNGEKIRILIHHAPTYGGSSGGPILNDDGEVVGVNFAGDAWISRNYRATIGNRFHNYGVPVDEIIKELKGNLSYETYNKIGISNKSFIPVNQLKKSLNNLYKKINSNEQFQTLLHKLKAIDSLEEFKQAEIKSNTIFINETLEEISRINLETKFLFKIISPNLNDLGHNFFKSFKKRIFHEKYDVLRDRVSYQRQLSICKQNYDQTNLDRCLFKTLYKENMFHELSSFSFGQNHKDQIWTELLRIIDQSSQNYFVFDNEETFHQQLSLAKREISINQIILNCILSIDQKFKQIDINTCLAVIPNLLSINGYTMVTNKLTRKLSNHMMANAKLGDILFNLNNSVLSVPIYCAFNNKRCERKKYGRFILNWRHVSHFNQQEIDQIIKVFTRFHQN